MLNLPSFFFIKNLTTEATEHTEVKWPKDLRNEARKDKKGHFSTLFRKTKTPKDLSEKDFCAFCSLLFHPLAFIPGGSSEKFFIPRKENITTHRRDEGGRRENETTKIRFMFLVFWKKILCDLCVLCG
jgi:hypothetical protein